MSGRNMKMVACAAMIALVSCGRAEGNPAGAPDVSASASADTSEIPVPRRVDKDLELDGMPLTLSPLAESTQPPIDATRLGEILLHDPGFLQYFPTTPDRAKADIELGLVTDAGVADPDGGTSSSYPGYVISGGSSTCVFSGPPTDKPRGPVRCSTVIIVNAIDGSIPRRQDREILP